MAAFPNQCFTILSVDELNAQEQEIIANFLAQHARSVDGMHLHCIQLKDTILHAPPGVEARSWNDSALNDENYIPWLQKNIVGSNRNSVTVVCGPIASGKTTLIRKEIAKLQADKATIYIHEDFSLSKATQSLRSQFQHSKCSHRAVQISLTTDENSMRDMLLQINNFFNSFLLLKTIYDSSTGSCLYNGNHTYQLFVEVGCVEDQDSCLAWLWRCIPIISCCCEIIEPPLEYIIDDQTRRVCTYLRAFDDGTIDRKFNSVSFNKRIYFVLDYSGSMAIDLGGRTALEVATDCMLGIFESHVQLMDVSAI